MIPQVTAGVIVLGGTAGAVRLSFSGSQLRQSWRKLPHIFQKPQDEIPKLVARRVRLAYRAGRERLQGILSQDAVAAAWTTGWIRSSSPSLVPKGQLGKRVPPQVPTGRDLRHDLR